MIHSVFICLGASQFASLHTLHPARPGGEGGAAESILRIEKLLGTSIEFHELDLLDKPALMKLFEKVKGA